jgi:octaprenyl-diphosphate synthase
MVLRDRGFLRVQPEEIVAIVRDTGALERTLLRAREYAEHARRCLDVAPDSIYRQALAAVPQFILEREY